MGRPRKTKPSKAKIKIKTKTYIGNPGKRAKMQVDSLKKAAPEPANIITMGIVLAALVGIFGSAVHFSIQINDFVRYARIQSAKQDAHS